MVFAEKMGSTSACGGLAFIRDDAVRIDELGAPQGNGFRSSLVSLMVVNPTRCERDMERGKEQGRYGIKKGACGKNRGAPRYPPPVLYMG